MDQYGSLTCCEADADLVFSALSKMGACVFCLDVGDGGAMIVCITKSFITIGQMPFGGNPLNRAYVGVYGRGCNHLSYDAIHPGYIAEKLSISDSEAEVFSKFWSMIWGRLENGL